MKNCLLIGSFLVLLGVATTFGQNNSATDCGTASIKFDCPADSDVLVSSKKDKPFIAVGRTSKVVLFAVEIGEKKTAYENAPFMDAVDKTLRKVFSDHEQSDFVYRISKDDLASYKYSAHEEYKRAVVVFRERGNELLHVRVSVINFSNKRLLVGFVRSVEKGNGAKKSFDQWTGTGSATADAELKSLANSITRET